MLVPQEGKGVPIRGAIANIGVNKAFEAVQERLRWNQTTSPSSVVRGHHAVYKSADDPVAVVGSRLHSLWNDY